jgi:hypothetical protein
MPCPEARSGWISDLGSPDAGDRRTAAAAARTPPQDRPAGARGRSSPESSSGPSTIRRRCSGTAVALDQRAIDSSQPSHRLCSQDLGDRPVEEELDVPCFSPVVRLISGIEAHRRRQAIRERSPPRSGRSRTISRLGRGAGTRSRIEGEGLGARSARLPDRLLAIGRSGTEISPS